VSDARYTLTVDGASIDFTGQVSELCEAAALLMNTSEGEDPVAYREVADRLLLALDKFYDDPDLRPLE
jgi:hypothetical protein